MKQLTQQTEILWQRSSLPPSPTPAVFKEIKAILIETFWVIAVAVFWMAVLPIAALFIFGIAISERAEAFKTRVTCSRIRAGTRSRPILQRSELLRG
jgi:hypothetical protein